MQSPAGAARDIAVRPLDKLRASAFGCLHVAQKDSGKGTLAIYIELAIKLAQMLTFVLSTEAGFKWFSSSTSGLKLILGLTVINGYADWYTGSAFLGLYYFSFLWVSVLSGLFAWGMYCFAQGNFPALWPLKALRMIAGMSATVLYIPMLTILLAGFRCENETVLFKGVGSSPALAQAHAAHTITSWWQASSFNCASPGWYIQEAVNGVLLIVFVLLCALWVGCVQDRHPLSKNQAAKSHGKMELYMLLSKTLLVALVKGWPGNVPVAVNIIALLLVGLVWTLGTAYYLANYNHSLNRANCAAAMVFLSSCVWLVVAEVYPTFDAAVAWYVSIPGVILAGITLVDTRAAWVQTAPLTSLLSPIDIDLRVRYILHEALFGHATATLPAHQRSLVRQDQATRAAGTAGMEVHKPGYGGPADESLPLKPLSNGFMPAPGLAEDMVELEQEEDMETRIAIAQRILARASAASKAGDGSDPLAEAASVYTYGLSRFRSSAWIHLWVSRHHAAYTGNKHLQMTHLLQAGRKSAALDVQYVIFTTRRAMDETGPAPAGTGVPGAAGGGNGGGGKATALSRVAFEKYLADAKEYVRAALGAQARFWAELCNVRPDLDALQKLVSTMSTSSDAATTCFREISRINAQSLAAIRLQAEFTAYALNDPERAALLVAEANRIEEGTLKELANTAGKRFAFLEKASVGIMGDAAGLLVVSASPGSLGTILSASPAACRLLGYPKWQLERRSVELLVPPPVSDFHGAILRHFLASGHSRLGDITTQMLLQHRSGFLAPILFTWHEVDTPSGPAFEALIQPVDVKDEYLMMDASFAVCSTTAKAMTHLGFDPNALGRREVNLRALLSSAEAQPGHEGGSSGAPPPLSARGDHGGGSGEHVAATAEKAQNEAWNTLLQQLQSAAGALVALHPVNSGRDTYESALSAGGETSNPYAYPPVTPNPTPLGYPPAYTAGGTSTPLPSGRAGSTEHTPKAGTTTGRGIASEAQLRRKSGHRGSKRGSGANPTLTLAPQDVSPTIVRAWLVHHHAASGDDFYTVTWTWPTGAESSMLATARSAARAVGGGAWGTGHGGRASHVAELSDETAPSSYAPHSAAPHKTSAGALGSCPFLASGRAGAGEGGSAAVPRLPVPPNALPTKEQIKDADTPDAVTVSSVAGGASDGERGSETDSRADDERLLRVSTSPRRAVVPHDDGHVVTAAELMKASSPRGLVKIGSKARMTGPKAHTQVVKSSRSSQSEDDAEARRHGGRGSRSSSSRNNNDDDDEDEEDDEDDADSTHAPSKLPVRKPLNHYASASSGGGGAGGGTGGEGSVASSSRSVTTRRLIARFRRVIEEDKQPMMLTLSRLRIIALVVSVIAAAVAIVLEVVSLDALRHIERTIEVANINQELIQSVMAVRHSMAVVAHFNQGQTINTSDAYADGRLAWATGRIEWAIRDVQRLYDMSRATGGHLFQVYTTPNVDYIRTTLDGGTGEPTHTTVRLSLHEAVSEVMYATYRLAQVPRPLITMDSLDFWPIRNNAVPGQPFFVAVNKTVTDSLGIAVDSSVQIRELLTTVLASIIGVLGASCVIVLFPLVLNFEKEKDGLFKEFLALPPVVLNSLRVQTERRLQAIQNEDLDDGEESEDGADDAQGGNGQGGQDFEAVGMDGTPGAGRSGEGVLLPTDEDGDFDWRMLVQAANSSGGGSGVNSRGSISMAGGSAGAGDGPRFSRVAFAEDAPTPTLATKGALLSPDARTAPLLAVPQQGMGAGQAKVQSVGWFAGMAGYSRNKQSNAAGAVSTPTTMVVVAGSGEAGAAVLPTPTGAGVSKGTRGPASRSKRHASAWLAQKGRKTTGKSVINGIKLLGVTTLPLLVLLVVLLVSLFQSKADIDDLQRFANAAAAFRQRSYTIRTAYSSLRRAMIQLSDPASVAPDIAVMRQSLADLSWWGTHLHLLAPLDEAEEAAADIRDMVRRTRGLGRGLGIRGLSAGESQILASVSMGSAINGVQMTLCDELRMEGNPDFTTRFPTPESCLSFPNGVKSTQAGLMQVENDVIRAMNQVADRRLLVDLAPPANLTHATMVIPNSNRTARYSMAEELLGTAWIDTAIEGIMLPAYRVQFSTYKRAVERSYNEFVQFHTSILVAGIGVYAVLLYVVYGIYIVRLNQSTRKQRGVLLLLPYQVFELPVGGALKGIMQGTLADMGISVTNSGGAPSSAHSVASGGR